MFFFSSRRRHTRCSRDWSSDVCSSDLGGRRILLEAGLEGDELSFIIVTDGKRYAPLVPARDHKRLLDGNQGPNTGGMGAYSTDALLPEELRTSIVASVLEPTLAGLADQGTPYQGFPYIGLMPRPCR